MIQPNLPNDAMARFFEQLSRNATQPELRERYREALEYLPFFSGQQPGDNTRCHPKSRNNIETKCDDWLFAFKMFQQNGLGESYNRRAFFERLTGSALEIMSNMRLDPNYQVPQLEYELRILFCNPRTLVQIWKEIKNFQRKPGQSITTYMMQLEKLYTELVTLRCLTRQAQRYSLWIRFLADCTTPDLRDKLKDRRLHEPEHLNLAMSMAQAYYNEHEKEPWALVFVQKEIAKSRDRRNSRGGYDRSRSGRGRGAQNNSPVNAVQRFTGNCHSCGIQGHKTVDCVVGMDTIRANSSNNQQQSSSRSQNSSSGNRRGSTRPPPPDGRRCSHCNRDGHLANECRTFERIRNHLAQTEGIGQQQQGSASAGRGRGQNQNRGRGQGSSSRGRGNRGRGRSWDAWSAGRQAQARGRGRGRGNFRSVNAVGIMEHDDNEPFDTGEEPQDQYDTCPEDESTAGDATLNQFHSGN